jgi:hypothetical protein
MLRQRRPDQLLLAIALAAIVAAACGQAAPTTSVATATVETGVGVDATASPAAGENPPPATEAGGAQAVAWTVELVQNGQAFPTEAGQVTLLRAPFTLRVTLPQPLPVKLNVNADDANFIALQPGYVFAEDCFEALCTGMDVAEERLNPTQVLFVDPMSTHYLYYQGPEDHRWSRATVTETSAVFERDVALLNDVPIQDFGASELYLLLFVDSINPGTIDPGELKKIAVSLQ